MNTCIGIKLRVHSLKIILILATTKILKTGTSKIITLNTLNMELFGFIIEYCSKRCKWKIEHCSPGSGCSKLTTSIVDKRLKFQTLISEIGQYFLLKKCEKLLQCKSFSHLFEQKYQFIWL